MHKPRYILENIVRPNVAELAAEYASEQKAFNAAAAVDALVASLFFWCEANDPSRVARIKDDTHFRGALAAKNSDYALLRDVAKALKHVELRVAAPALLEHLHDDALIHLIHQNLT